MAKHTQQRRQWQPTPVLLPGKSHGWRNLVGCSPWGCKELDMTQWLHFHALEKEMATHSSVLAWRIPGTGEPGGLPPMGLHGVRYDWSDLAAAADTLRESPTLLVVWITFMGHFFWVSFDWSSWFAWFWVCVWYPSGSSTWVYTSFSQDGIQQSGLWVVASLTVRWCPSPWTSKEPFGTCIVREASLTLRMRNMWSVISYLVRAQPLLSSCFYGVSVHEGETVQPGVHLSPASNWRQSIQPRSWEPRFIPCTKLRT